MHLDKIFDFSNALPKNHLDVSSADEVEITYTERENSSVIHPQKIKKQGWKVTEIMTMDLL